MNDRTVCGDLTGLDETELRASLGGEDHHRRSTREQNIRNCHCADLLGLT